MLLGRRERSIVCYELVSASQDVRVDPLDLLNGVSEACRNVDIRVILDVNRKGIASYIALRSDSAGDMKLCAEVIKAVLSVKFPGMISCRGIDCKVIGPF